MASEKASGALSGAASGAAAGASFGPWGALIGGVVGGAAALLGPGQKAAPQAEFKPVDVQAEQQKALAGNLANFGQASTLSGKANSFNQSESIRLLEKALPGIGAIQQRLLGQVNADLNGGNNLPPELQQQIARQAAEKGVTRGTSGNFQQFSALKDFGFNLIDWQNASRARAMNTLSTVYGMAPRVNIMSPMSSMVDPNTAIKLPARTIKASRTPRRPDTIPRPQPATTKTPRFPASSKRWAPLPERTPVRSCPHPPSPRRRRTTLATNNASPCLTPISNPATQAPSSTIKS